MIQVYAKRTYLTFIMALCLTLAIPFGTAAAAAATTVESSLHKPLRSDAVLRLGSTSAVVNGMTMTVQPVYEKNGVTMAPVNVLIRMFRLDYSYDQKNRSFWLKTRLFEQQQLSFKLGERKGESNNGLKIRTFTLSAAPLEKKGSLMVPLRDIVEQLGGKVTYDAKTKEVRIKGVDKPVTDSKYRIGDSSRGWSIAAPAGFKPENLGKIETCEGCFAISGFASDREYLLIVSVSDSNSRLTLKQLQEQTVAKLHPSQVVQESRFAKQPAGEFSVVSTSWNDAFTARYNEYWTIQADERIYTIVFIQGSYGNGHIIGERDRIALAFMETFKTTFTSGNPNQIDTYEKL
ncbi:copper amine oxidase N-terminal domain-containing protein [Paenibacillus gorillae]|uniref:copper amine oxidase N-terminal domain-containing protein n=1 Tax=Paenibacillus gorillae TaxID=1243662 RepID=UPI00138AB29F|nr:copper amine oxidase N-terminal domain-containing protein [Paenibacillus gorillae]